MSISPDCCPNCQAPFVLGDTVMYEGLRAKHDIELCLCLFCMTLVVFVDGVMEVSTVYCLADFDGSWVYRPIAECDRLG